MTNTQKTVGGVLVAALLVLVGFLAAGSGHSGAPEAGSTVNPNPQWFPTGIKIGTDNNLRLTGVLTIGVGQNQASVKNLTGSTIYVTYGAAQMLGTASSTFNLNVGTSTAATVTNQFSLSTSPLWAQFIDADQVATGTVASLISDNITNHKSSYPATLQVNNGQYFTAVVSTFCTASGACETATSSRRGWTTITIPYSYNYNSPN